MAWILATVPRGSLVIGTERDVEACSTMDDIEDDVNINDEFDEINGECIGNVDDEDDKMTEKSLTDEADESSGAMLELMSAAATCSAVFSVSMSIRSMSAKPTGS